MKTIPLTQGKEAMVDDQDYETLSKYKWCAARKGSHEEKWYAERQIRVGVRKQRTQYMHRALMTPPVGCMIDHRDGNGLNNCRSNLRVCTRGDNIANSSGSRNRKSIYKGVYQGNEKSWQVAIRFHNKLLYLGSYATQEEAARAYDKAIVKLRGNFAVLNFPMRTGNQNPRKGRQA